SDAVVAVFNCFGDPAAAVAVAGWVENPVAADCAAVLARHARVVRVARDAAVPLVLRSGEAEVVAFAPIEGKEFGVGIACLGLMGKLNGLAAIEATTFTLNADGTSATFAATLWASGLVGLFVDLPAGATLASVVVDGDSKLLVPNVTSQTASGAVGDGLDWDAAERVLRVNCGHEEIRRMRVELVLLAGGAKA
ncbi:hypothetical protein HK405_012690, partial [Cladochytrium tenue]